MGYKFSILDSSVISLTNYDVLPFQAIVPEGEKEEFVIDESFYKQDCYFPNKLVELNKPCIWRDINVSSLGIFPIRFNPVTKTLIIYKNIVIQINLVSILGNEFVRNKIISKDWENLYKSSIVNYNCSPKMLTKNSSKTTSGEYDYLIITADDYLETIQPFAKWKTRKGFFSKVVSIDNIGNNQTSIKNYISSEFTNNNISYVLFVGDESDIVQSCDPQYQLWGDYWYSLLSGSDYYPEISIGRISVTTETELEHIFYKGLIYESTPPNDNWIKNVLLISHHENPTYFASFQSLSEKIRTASYSYTTPSFITAYGASYADSGDEATNSMVTNYINSGLGIVNYRGHGGGECWWNWNIFSENYSNIQAYALNNGKKQPIVFSIACNTSHLMSSSDCLAEVFTKADYGATAFLGATGATYGEANDIIDQSLFEACFDLNIHSIGQIFTFAISKMLKENIVGNSDIWSALKYLWLGDPAIELWKSTFSTFNSPSVTVNSNNIIVNSNIPGSNIIACSIDNGESYFSKVENTSSAIFSTSFHPLYITITKNDFLPYQAITGGILNEDMEVFGKVKILGDITVASGKTLTIAEGTKLIFENNSKLIVNGTLNVNGTASNKATFDFVSQSSSNGIYCYSGSDVNINNAIIKNAKYGVYADHCSPIIKNTNITNSNLAVRSLYSKPTIENCYISDCDGGIYIYYTNSTQIEDLTIRNNKIEDLGSCGIYLYQSTGHIRGNEISNCWRGVYGNNTSTAYLGEVGYYGNNKIYNNDYGVYAYNNTYMLLGRVACTVIGGNNSVWGNSNKNAYSASNGSDIQAAKTWWGSAPPPTNKFYVASGCTLIYSDYLTSNPLAKIASNNNSPEETLFNSNINKATDETIKKTYNYDEKWSLDWKINYVRNLVLVKDYKYAQKICEEIINKYPDSTQAITALSLYQQSSKEDNFKSFINFLNSKVNSKKTTTLNGMMEMCLLDLENIELKNPNKYEKLVSKYESKEMEESMLFHDFTYNLVVLNDYENAKKISKELDAKFKDSNLAIEAQILLGESVEEPIISPKNLGKDSQEQIVEQYELLGNYPNPFNPSTKIRYAIPFTSKVNLEIYDVAGKIIKSFEISSQSTGNHEIIWNGTNINGNRVASGIYLYKLHIESLEGNGETFEKTAKLLLIK